MKIPDHAHALYLQLTGERNLAVADLKVYVHASAGIGDHPDVGKVYRKKLKEIERAQSLISLMEQIFTNIENGPQVPNLKAQKTQQTQPSQNPTPEKDSNQNSSEKDEGNINLNSDTKSVGTFSNKNS